LLEDSSGDAIDVSVVFFDRARFPKKALLSLNINLVEKQLHVKNYATVGPEVPDKNFFLPKVFSETENLTDQELKLSFWFPQDDIVIFVRYQPNLVGKVV